MTKNEELLKLMHKLSVMGRRTPPPRPNDRLPKSDDEHMPAQPPRPEHREPPRPEHREPPRPEHREPPHHGHCEPPHDDHHMPPHPRHHKPPHCGHHEPPHHMPPMPPRRPERPSPLMPPRREARILPILNEKGSMSQKELAEIIGIRPQSLSEAIRRLEVDGMVKREENEEDKRQTLVSLTEEGKKRIDELSENRQRYAEQFFSVLTEDEKDTLISLLKKLTEIRE